MLSFGDMRFVFVSSMWFLNILLVGIVTLVVISIQDNIIYGRENEYIKIIV